MDYYLKAIEMGPENQEAWKHLGLLFLAQGEYEKAYNALKDALEKGEKSAEYYMKDYKNAVNELKEALRLEPYNQEALLLWEQVKTLCPDPCD